MKKILLFTLILSLFLFTSVSAGEIIYLSNSAGVCINPCFSPDVNKIVYTMASSGYNPEIWIMDANGNNKQQISSSISGYAFNYPWSYDSTKLIFSSQTPLSTGFWVQDIHTGRKYLLSGIKNINSYQWISDSRIFIATKGVKKQELWLIDFDGTNKSLLTTLSGDNSGFLWQPKGNNIIYVSNVSGNNDIWIMDTQSFEKKQLTATPDNEYAAGLAFSPDGKRIVYASRNSVDRTNISSFEGFYTAVWVMDATGSDKKQIQAPDNGVYLYPSWSPDGRKIAFEYRDSISQRPDIFVINYDGADSTILTANTSGGAFPNWSQRGDRIVFVAPSNMGSNIASIFLDDKWISAPASLLASQDDTALSNNSALPEGSSKTSLVDISEKSNTKISGFTFFSALGAMLLSLTLIRRKIL